MTEEGEMQVLQESACYRTYRFTPNPPTNHKHPVSEGVYALRMCLKKETGPWVLDTAAMEWERERDFAGASKTDLLDFFHASVEIVLRHKCTPSFGWVLYENPGLIKNTDCLNGAYNVGRPWGWTEAQWLVIKVLTGLRHPDDAALARNLLAMTELRGQYDFRVDGELGLNILVDTACISGLVMVLNVKWSSFADKSTAIESLRERAQKRMAEATDAQEKQAMLYITGMPHPLGSESYYK